MMDKILRVIAFFGNPVNATKLTAAAFAVFAIIAQARSPHPDATVIATSLAVVCGTIASLATAAKTTAKIETAVADVKVAQVEAHGVNAARISDLENTVMTVAEGVKAVADKTDTDLKVPIYTPTPKPAPAVPADELARIIRESKGNQS